VRQGLEETNGLRFQPHKVDFTGGSDATSADEEQEKNDIKRSEVEGGRGQRGGTEQKRIRQAFIEIARKQKPARAC